MAAGDSVLTTEILGGAPLPASPAASPVASPRSRSVPSRVPSHRQRPAQVPEVTPVPLCSHTHSAGDCKGPPRGRGPGAWRRAPGRLPSWAGTPQDKRPGRPPDPRRPLRAARHPRRLPPDAAAALASRAAAPASAAAAAPPPAHAVRRAMSFEALATRVEAGGSVRVVPAAAGRWVVVSLQGPFARLMDVTA